MCQDTLTRRNGSLGVMEKGYAREEREGGRNPANEKKKKKTKEKEIGHARCWVVGPSGVWACSRLTLITGLDVGSCKTADNGP